MLCPNLESVGSPGTILKRQSKLICSTQIKTDQRSETKKPWFQL